MQTDFDDKKYRPAGRKSFTKNTHLFPRFSDEIVDACGHFDGQRLDDERRLDGTLLEQIRMVADLAQLHQDVEHGEHTAAAQFVFRAEQQTKDVNPFVCFKQTHRRFEVSRRNPIWKMTLII